MSASEIKGNEVEGGKQPEREPRAPSEQDKSKLQPSENAEQKETPKEGGDSNRRNNSEHPKIEPSDGNERNSHDPSSEQKHNEHPKLAEQTGSTPSDNGKENGSNPVESSKERNPSKGEDTKPADGSKETADPKGDGTKPADGGKETADPKGDGTKPADGGKETADPKGDGTKPADGGKETVDPKGDGTKPADGGKETADPKGDGTKPADGGKEAADPKGDGTKPADGGKETADPKDAKPAESTKEGNEAEDPDYKNRYDRTPKNHGEWVNEDGSPGQRGESKFVPDDPDVQKTLQDNGVDGINYNDCYPDMSPVSKFDAYLDPEDYLKSDRDQFQMCNDSLADAVLPDPDTGEIENPELAAQFTPDQLADIEAGDTPDGYTWHHDVDSGHMQLVPTDVHQACRHAGGRSVWGGGADYR